MLNKPWVDCNGGLYLVFPSILKKKKNQPFCPLADIFKNGNEGRNLMQPIPHSLQENV